MSEKGSIPAERVKQPEKPRSARMSVGAMWVASGLVAEHAGKRKVENIDEAVQKIPQRVPSDLSEHHARVGDFSLMERSMHWDDRAAKNPELVDKNKQIAGWRDDVFSFLQELQNDNKPSFETIIAHVLRIPEEAYENEQTYGKAVEDSIEQFRQKYLIGKPKIEQFARDFTGDYPLDDNIRDVELIAPFLGVFGNSPEVHQLIKDAVVAQAYVNDLQHVDEQPQLLETARQILSEELSEEHAALYAKLYGKPVEMAQGEEHTVSGMTPPLEDLAEDAPVVGGTGEGNQEGTAAESERPVWPTNEVPEEKEKEKVLSFGDFQQAAMERELQQFPELQTWVNESLDKLPEMTTTKAPLTNEKWKADTKQDGEVERIAGSFFTIEGTHIATPAFSWDQPGIWQAGVETQIPTSEGVLKAKVSGLVGMISDKDGNVLLSFVQEPYAETPKHALLRTPFQTSAQKFNDLQAGQVEKDPSLVKLLDILYGEDSFKEFTSQLQSGDIPVKILAPADANRVHATNLRMEITVDDEQKRKALEMDGKNRWVSQKEFQALVDAGLVNGHTIAANGSAVSR